MADDNVRPDRPHRPREDYQQDVPRRKQRRLEDDYDEDYDDYDVRRSSSNDGLNTLIPYKNPQALVGYYLSVFSLIPCLGGLFLSPAAIVLGILGIRYRKRHPTAGGMAHAVVAMVLGGITTLLNWGASITLMIAAIANK